MAMPAAMIAAPIGDNASPTNLSGDNNPRTIAPPILGNSTPKFANAKPSRAIGYKTKLKTVLNAPKIVNAPPIAPAIITMFDVSFGFSIIQFLIRSITPPILSIKRSSVGASVPPMTELRLNNLFLKMPHLDDKAFILVSNSRPIEPFAASLFASSICLRHSSVFETNNASVFVCSVPTKSAMVPSRFDSGSFLSASTILKIVPCASLTMPNSTAFALNPNAAKPFLTGFFLLACDKRVKIALTAVADCSSAAPAVCKVEPKAAMFFSLILAMPEIPDTRFINPMISVPLEIALSSR